MLTRRSLLATVPTLGLAAVKGRSYSTASPEFTLELAAGQKINLSSFRGKCVAIEIFKTTCPHCQESMPIVQKLYKEYAAKGFQPLAVAVDQYPATLVAEFVKRYGITFPVGWASIEDICAFLEIQPQQLYVPTLATFQRSGKVHARHLAGEPFFNMQEANLRNEIEYLLAPAKAAPKKTAKKA
jgi:cytochrome oxidase Cu insertion factor (SCO1/SenC/PrrC family)